MRQSEIKMRYDPEMGRFVKRHIYGEGIMDLIKFVGSKVFGDTTKKIAKKAVTKGVTRTAEKTGEFIGNKAGDKIIQLLSKKQPAVQHSISQPPADRPLTDFEIAES